MAEQQVALKVLKNGSLAALQREVEALNNLEHQSIVRIIDYGKLSNGSAFLAMEYLEGPTLRHFCQRTTRLSESELVDALFKLGSALVTIHPDEDLVAQLRARDDLSIDELGQLSAARHGYVHRDIKPENIIYVPNRGPVLLDFGISVRVSQPVLTLSSTPGYLPPDGVAGTWTADIDLFQLGITLLQAGIGIEFDGHNLDDLRTAARDELSPRLAAILCRLSHDERAHRYRSAKEMLGDAKTLPSSDAR